MKTTKTPKGTILPLMNLKGKDYLQVAHRLVWFREQEPDAGIETTYLTLTEDHAVVQARILRDGRVVSTGTKRETKKDFPDFTEKAETGAVGRALAMLGYGTQFTLPDLDEGSRLADSPVDTSVQVAAQVTPNNVVKVAEEAIATQPVAKPKVSSPSPFKKPAPKITQVVNNNVEAKEASTTTVYE